jgi:periplasmic protein TonB
VSGIKFPLTLSVAGHAACLALLILLLRETPPAPEPLATGGIEVVFAPLPKPEEPQPPTQAEIPPPQVETPPPAPEPMSPPLDEPVAAIEPPPPAPETPVPVVQPPPPPKPAVKPPPKPVHHHLEQAAPNPTPAPSQPTQAAVAAPQTAYAPAPVPSTEVSPGYRALLSAWLESHKRYPDSARQRGEEGRAVLRFAVDRTGRVLDFAVLHSSGYPDLDSSIEEMMRSAVLPPFPASMTQSRIDVSVTIRFSLAR